MDKGKENSKQVSVVIHRKTAKLFTLAKCQHVWATEGSGHYISTFVVFAHLKFHFFPPRRRAQLCALCFARIKYQHGKQSKTILTNKQNGNPNLLNPFWLLNHSDQMLKRIYYWRIIPLKDNIVQKKDRKCKKVVLKKAGILHDTRVWTHLDVSDISAPAKRVNASSPR